MTTVSTAVERRVDCVNSSYLGTEDGATDIVSLFRMAALSHCDRIAIVVGELSFSYRELDLGSDRIAQHLADNGVKPESAVGFLLDRSVPVPLGFIGILKAGGAYLPLDVENAPDRIRHMVASASMSVLLTCNRLRGQAQALCPELSIITIEEALAHSNPLPAAPIDPESLAIVLYTSGSTGQPKGVELTHRSLATYFRSLQVEVNLVPGDIGFGAIAFSFDLSVQEMLLPLLHGGEYRLLSRQVTCDGRVLGPILDTPRQAFLTTTPATLKLLWDASWKGAPQLTVLSGGETLHPGVAKYVHERTARLYNMYGPAEVTVAVTMYRVQGNESRVPLGQPLPHCELFILDGQGRFCAPGDHGELYLGGVQVGRGYRNRPDLTDQRFIMLDLPDARRIRTYRTGDVASLDDDGLVHFHGRCDNQVKLRGHRIELEEIELTLAKHPKILEVAVCLKSFGEDDERLVAYFSSRTDPPPTPAVLQDFVKTSLPAYMVPRHYQHRAELPKNVHRKIDRRSLNAESWLLLSGVSPGESSDTEALPETTTEKRLLVIWRAFPGFARCSITDKFFDLGGHSLLAAQLFQQLNREFGTHLPVSTLLTSPSVRAVAAILDEGRTDPEWSPLVPIRKEGTSSPVLFVHALGGNLLTFHELSSAISKDIPLYGLQARGVLSGMSPHATVSDMAAEYTAAIRKVRPSGPYVLVGYSAGGPVVLEMARQLVAKDGTIGAIVILDSPLDKRGAMFPVLPFRQFTTSVISGLGKLVQKRVPYSTEMKNGETVGEASSSDWMNPFRLLAMETRLAARKLAFLKTLIPNRFPDSFVAALRQYRAEPIKGDCPAVVFRATKERRLARTDETLGWGRLVSRLEVKSVPTNHWALVERPHVLEIAATIERYCGGAGLDANSAVDVKVEPPFSRGA